MNKPTITIETKVPVRVTCRKFSFGYCISISYLTERYRYETCYIHSVGKDIIRFDILDTYTDVICGKIFVSYVNTRSVVYQMREKETENHLLIDNKILLDCECFVEECNDKSGQPS